MIKKILVLTSKILTTLIFLLTFYIIIYGSIAIRNNELVNIFGYSYGFVPTSSMDGNKPEGAKINGFKKNSIIIIKKEEFNNLDINDVVVYKSSDNVLVVHRIVDNLDDDKYIVKGDNNNDIDKEYVISSNYEGKVVKSFYFFGLFGLLQNSKSLLLLVLIIVLIIIMLTQIFNIIKIKHEKNKEKNTLDEVEKRVEARMKDLK